MINGRVHNRGGCHGDECEYHRRSDHRRSWHPQYVDQHRHQQKAAADAHNCSDKPDDESDPPDRDGGDINARAFEAQLQG